MSYGDNTGLGIAPAVILAGASSVIKLFTSLFGGPPKPIDATTLAALQKSINTQLKVWADSYDLGLTVHANSIRDGTLTKWAQSQDANLAAMARAALDAISAYSAALPPGSVQFPEYSGIYGVPVTKQYYDDAKAAGGARAASVNTRAERVAAMAGDPRNAPAAPVTAPTLQEKKDAAKSGTTLYQAGVIGNALPLLLIGGVVFFVASRFKGR